MVLHRTPGWNALLRHHVTYTDCLSLETVLDSVKTAELHSEFLGNIPFSYRQSPTVCTKIANSRFGKLVNNFPIYAQWNAFLNAHCFSLFRLLSFTEKYTWNSRPCLPLPWKFMSLHCWITFHVGTYWNFFTHPPFAGHICWFLVLTIINKTGINI